MSDHTDHTSNGREIGGDVEVLRGVARRIAGAIPVVDQYAEHTRWDPGIGPFEEDNQLKMILEELADEADRPDDIEVEVPYPDSGKLCDIVAMGVEGGLPIEAKLLRFRLDNGNIDPNMYKSVFSPFPERGSSSLLTDAKKLDESGFAHQGGLVGLYYEEENEEYDQLRAEKIAEKVELDVKFWYGLELIRVALEPFEGLRHSHHQRGAVIAWLLPA